MSDNTMTLDEMAGKIVRDDIYCNVDSFVRYILQKSSDDDNAPISYDDLENETPDFYGMTKKELKSFLRDEFGWNSDDWKGMDHDDLVSACQDNYETGEVYEYWAISDWLYNKLKDRGQIVIDAYPQIWGRQTTGQAIVLDGVIRSIAKDILRAQLTKNKSKK